MASFNIISKELKAKAKDKEIKKLISKALVKAIRQFK